MEAKKDQFPAGLRVLVVDDDRTCLYIIDKMLRRCSYTVTTCGLARIALAMLRENKDKFDLVISDVYMPDMDGFKLLELVGLEMDLPVIMMSANGETSVVMKGITHGACDYLLKPIRMEELRNIWQHVVRKKRIASKDPDQSTSADEKINKRASDDCDPTTSTSSKRRKDVKEEDDDNDPESDDPSTLKKPRVVWSVELHQQFVNAVNRLGIEKAVPKRILELMNVQGLTRENVASHLQKYRLYLKRLSGAHHQNGMALSFGSVSDSPFSSVNVLDGLGDLRTHPVIGQTPNPAFTALHWAYLNRMCPTNSMSAPTLDSSVLMQSAALQAANRGPVIRPQIPAVVGQASFLHPMSHDMEHNASGQITSFGHLRSPIDDVTGIHCAQNQIVTASGLGGLSTIGGMNCNTSSTINTTLMSQQQQHSQQAAASLTLPVGTTRQQLMPELSRGQFSSLCLKTGDLGSPSMKVNPLGLCAAVPHTEGLVNTCDMENRNDTFGVLGSNCSESSDMSFNMVGVKTNNATAARDFNLDLEFQEDRKPYIKSPDMGRFGSPHKGNDQSSRAGWQGLNLNPGFSNSSSCSYPSVSIGGPNANVSASQVQVEADPLEDAKRTSSTSNRLYARGGQHFEQVMGNALKIKEERTLDSVINGFSTEQVLPDDILNFFFKQTCDNDSGNAVIQQDGYWRVPPTDGLFAVPEL